MKKLILSLGRALLNLIYPLTCRICRVRLDVNKGLCGECVSKIQRNEFGIAACRYEGVLKEAVHLFKYKGTLSLAGAFSDFILEFIEKNIDMKNIDAIVPVPLHPAKLRERGFNQAYLLSVPISKKYNIPIYTDLIKIRPTPPQSNLDRPRRLKNLKNAFSVKDGGSLKRKRVLLVDDVYTTGTTIDKASSALKRAGALSVKALTLAGGV